MSDLRQSLVANLTYTVHLLIWKRNWRKVVSGLFHVVLITFQRFCLNLILEASTKCQKITIF